jgi:TetR/AcrR family transcriptional regulator
VSSRPPADNRQKILREALALFAARGYATVAVQEIVAAVGVTKPTLYHYFGSKRGLLQALLEEIAAPFVDGLVERSAYQGDLPQTLTRVVKHNLDFAGREPLFYRLLLGLGFAPPESEEHELVRPYLQRQQQLLEEMFKEAVRDHGNLRGHHRLYAITLLGMVHQYALRILNREQRRDEELLYMVVKQFMYGMYAL